MNNRTRFLLATVLACGLARLSVVGSQRLLATTEVAGSLERQTLPGYATVDVNVRRTLFRTLDAFLAIESALDRRYRTLNPGAYTNPEELVGAPQNPRRVSGSQVQHEASSGAGVQPTARVMWKALPHQRLWAASSRALRTPSLYEREIRMGFPAVPSASGLPLVITVLGNPAAKTETPVDAEAGYRLEIGTAASIDVTGFVGRYDHLRTQEPGAPTVQFVPSPHILVTSQFGNQLEATTRGLEVAANWAPVRVWRLDGSYTAFHVTPQLAAASQDPAAAREDGSAPRRQWQVRSAFSPGTRATLNVAVFHVGPLEQAHGQNLFAAAHAESAGAGSLLLVTQVPRSAGLRLRLTFP